MSELIVRGGSPLFGVLDIHGAKNSVLPILAATVLPASRCVVTRCPEITDVSAAGEILCCLGARFERTGGAVTVDSSSVENWCIPARLMEKMRASILFLGALLGRFRRAELTPPGGCALGLRPIDYHLQALQNLGVAVCEESGLLRFSWPDPHGGDVILPFPSVGATENLLLAAAAVEDETVIFGAAREPEVEDLCGFLSAMGAEITGAGTNTITVHGRENLCGTAYSVVPDRIEAATYLAMTAACGGCVRLRNTRPHHLQPVLQVLRRAGCRIHSTQNTITLERTAPLSGVGLVETAAYPGFPTDAQAPLLASLLKAEGESVFRETVFRERFQHIPQLIRFGGEIRVEADTAVVNGVQGLHGACAKATDLRGGAGVLIAALQAEGESTLQSAELIARGYGELLPNLRALGADVSQV